MARSVFVPWRSLVQGKAHDSYLSFMNTGSFLWRYQLPSVEQTIRSIILDSKARGKDLLLNLNTGAISTKRPRGGSAGDLQIGQGNQIQWKEWTKRPRADRKPWNSRERRLSKGERFGFGSMVGSWWPSKSSFGARRSVIISRNIHFTVHGRTKRPFQLSVHFLRKTNKAIFE